MYYWRVVLVGTYTGQVGYGTEDRIPFCVKQLHAFEGYGTVLSVTITAKMHRFLQDRVDVIISVRVCDSLAAREQIEYNSRNAGQRQR